MDQSSFAKHLIMNQNLMACDEVSHYNHRCDVLAVDTRKEVIYEYEFKNSSNDLKIAEYKKDKYHPLQKARCFFSEEKKMHVWAKYYVDYPKPNYFYFVMPLELFKKEEKFLRTLDVGVIAYEKVEHGDHYGGYQIYVEKRCKRTIKNLQKYHVAFENIAKRLANRFAWK